MDSKTANKIVTLICIFAIVATTAIVALASDGNTTYENDDPSVGADSLISQAVTGDTDSLLYPGSSLNRAVIISAGNSNDVLVRTVFAFEAENLETKDSFDGLFEVRFDADDCWEIGDCFPIIHEGEYYMMTSAVYTGIVSKGSSVSMSYSVKMKENVSISVAEQYADGIGYEVLVSSQGVQAEGWEADGSPVNYSNNIGAIKGILDKVFGKVDSDYPPIWNDQAGSEGY